MQICPARCRREQLHFVAIDFQRDQQLPSIASGSDPPRVVLSQSGLHPGPTVPSLQAGCT
jgi:hypothetical protein